MRPISQANPYYDVNLVLGIEDVDPLEYLHPPVIHLERDRSAEENDDPALARELRTVRSGLDQAS